jgi:SAM-dependent methyltransferase
MNSLDEMMENLGQIDIYVFDQIQRGRIRRGARILEAGCGGGRNLRFFLRAGYDVFGVDADASAIDSVRRAAATLAPSLPPDRFRVELVESLSFPEDHFDVVLSIAALHFSRSDAHFDAQILEMWRVLRPGGLFFSRLASNIGMESKMRPLGDSRYFLPDGSERYLVDEARLLEWTARLGATLLDPLKTTIVQNQRCMTTWVLCKTFEQRNATSRRA